jgi:hypothetical protein
MSDKDTGLLREALAWIENSAEKAPSLCADIRAALAAQEPACPPCTKGCAQIDACVDMKATWFAKPAAQAEEPEPVAWEIHAVKFANGKELVYKKPENLPSYIKARALVYLDSTHPAPAKPLSDEQAHKLCKEGGAVHCDTSGRVVSAAISRSTNGGKNRGAANWRGRSRNCGAIMSAAELEVVLAVARREQRREQIERRAKAGAALAFVIACFVGFVAVMFDVLVWRA